MARKIIITCAVTGGGDTVDKHPAIPVTPKQIAQAAIDAHAAGAAIAHIHVRDPETGKRCADPALFREVVERVKDSGCNVILNLTSGEGGRYVPRLDDPQKPAPGSNAIAPELRVRHILELRPEMCTLDVATMNFGDGVFMNTPSHLKVLAELIRESGAKPEIEVFDLGHLELAKNMLRQGLLDPEPLFQLCMGISWGAPATIEGLLAMRQGLPADAAWASFGVARAQFPIVAHAALIGGHVRVGLEDNLYIEQGVLARDNAQLVEKAVQIIRLLGFEPASSDEARQMLKLRQA